VIDFSPATKKGADGSGPDLCAAPEWCDKEQWAIVRLSGFTPGFLDADICAKS